MRKKLNSENIKACYNPRQTDTCFRSSAKLLLFGIVAWLCDSVVFVMHWFSKSVRCQKKYTATALEGHSLLFAFFHQSPSARKKKRKPFGADNDDDNNDEGWFVGGWSFHVIIIWFSHHLMYWQGCALQDFRQNAERVKRQWVLNTKQRYAQWLSDWVNAWPSNWEIEWLNNEWLSDWLSDWIMSNWVNEGMSDWLIDCVTDSWTISFISVTCVLQAELHCSIILRQREWLCLFNKIHLLFHVRKIMRRENPFWHFYLCLEATTNYFAELRRLKELSNVKKFLCYLSTESGRWREEEGKAWSVCLRTTPVKYA